MKSTVFELYCRSGVGSQIWMLERVACVGLLDVCMCEDASVGRFMCGLSLYVVRE